MLKVFTFDSCTDQTLNICCEAYLMVLFLIAKHSTQCFSFLLAVVLAHCAMIGPAAIIA